jgi:hypothetical protein
MGLLLKRTAFFMVLVSLWALLAAVVAYFST